MTNEELIKKLRDLHRDPRPASAVWLFENQVALYDAAAAIEDLQAQLPKRGEIVRCGECKWWHEFFIRGVGRGRGVCAVHTDPLECNADWFCADGEREVQE